MKKIISDKKLSKIIREAINNVTSQEKKLDPIVVSKTIFEECEINEDYGGIYHLIEQYTDYIENSDYSNEENPLQYLEGKGIKTANIYQKIGEYAINEFDEVKHNIMRFNKNGELMISRIIRTDDINIENLIDNEGHGIGVHWTYNVDNANNSWREDQEGKYQVTFLACTKDLDWLDMLRYYIFQCDWFENEYEINPREVTIYKILIDGKILKEFPKGLTVPTDK